MTLRFRQSFRLFPGVRINLGKRGLSASIGIPGATINVGRLGVRATTGIPGTGLSWSTRLGGPPGSVDAPEHWTPQPTERTPPAGLPGGRSLPTGNTMQHVRSGGIDGLTSAGMIELHGLLSAARAQAASVAAELSVTSAGLAREQSDFARRQRSIFRRFYKKRIVALEASIPILAEAKNTLLAWQVATHVEMDFETTGETGAAWDALVAAFLDAAKCKVIWDLVAARQVDRAAERSGAERAIDRKPVTFGLASSDLVRFGGSALRLGNANGADILIYPGIALIEAADGRFAVVDFADLAVTLTTATFTESEAVAADAEIIGKTWSKVNRDGSRDKRFAANFEIPSVKYAMLGLATAGGLNEQWLFSNFKRGEAFVAPLIEYRDVWAAANAAAADGAE